MKNIFLILLLTVPLKVLAQSEHAKLIFPCDETSQWLFDYLDLKIEKRQRKDLRKEFIRRFKETSKSKGLDYFMGKKCYAEQSSSNHYYKIRSFDIENNDLNQLEIRFFRPCPFVTTFSNNDDFIVLPGNKYSKYISKYDVEDIEKGILKRFVYKPLHFYIEYNTKWETILILSSDKVKNGIVKEAIKNNEVEKERKRLAEIRRVKRAKEMKQKRLKLEKEGNLKKLLAEELYAHIKSYPYSIKNNTNIDFSKPYYPKSGGNLASKLVAYGNLVVEKSIIKNGKPKNSIVGAGFFISKEDNPKKILEKLDDIRYSALSFKGNDITAMAGNSVRNRLPNVKALFFKKNEIVRIKTEELSEGKYISFIKSYKPNANQESYLSDKENLWWTKVSLTTDNKINQFANATVILNKDLKLRKITLPKKTEIKFQNYKSSKSVRSRDGEISFFSKDAIRIKFPDNSSIKGKFDPLGFPIGQHLYKDKSGRIHKNHYSTINFYNPSSRDYNLYSIKKYICIVKSDKNRDSPEENFFNLEAYTMHEAKNIAIEEQKKIKAKVDYEKSNSVAADLRRKANNPNSATNNIFRNNSAGGQGKGKKKSFVQKALDEYKTFKTYRLTNHGLKKCGVIIRLSKGRFAYGNNTTYWVDGNSTYDIKVTSDAIVYHLETLNCKSTITGDFVK